METDIPSKASVLVRLKGKGFHILAMAGAVNCFLCLYLYSGSLLSNYVQTDRLLETVECQKTISVTTDLIRNMTQVLSHMLSQTTDMTSSQVTVPCSVDVWNSCLPEACSQQLSSDPEERLTEILSTKLTLSDLERHSIAALSSSIPVSDVIFVSATSDNHYNETQAMVRSLHKVVYPRVKNMTFVLFDIGLTAEQRKKTQSACNCHLVTFPFEKFPAFFRAEGCYTWKPLIVMAAMMKANKLVVYQDASITWRDNVLELLDRGDELGIQLWGTDTMHNIPVATLKAMFDYMGDDPCAYLSYSQIQSGIIVLKQTPFVARAVIEPWAKCGLEKNCFCPDTTESHLYCKSPRKRIHMCHRYDQSALSIIVTKIFTSDRYRYHMPHVNTTSHRVAQMNGTYVIINRDLKAPTYFDSVIEGHGKEGGGGSSGEGEIERQSLIGL